MILTLITSASPNFAAQCRAVRPSLDFTVTFAPAYTVMFTRIFARSKDCMEKRPEISQSATKHSPVSHCHRTANLLGFAMLTSNSTFVTSACFAAAIRGVLPYASLELKSSGFSFNNWITAFTLPALETLCNAVGNTAGICTHGVNGRTSRVSIHVGGSRAGWKTSSD